MKKPVPITRLFAKAKAEECREIMYDLPHGRLMILVEMLAHTWDRVAEEAPEEPTPPATGTSGENSPNT